MTTVEQILLKLGIDQSQVGPGLNDFKGKVQAASGSVVGHLDNMANGARGFHKALEGINAFIPGLGSLAMVAFNPVTLAIVAAAKALEYFNKQIEEYNARVDKMAERLERAAADPAKAAARAHEELARLNQEFEIWLAHNESAAAKITRQLQLQVEAIKDQGSANEKLLAQRTRQAGMGIDAREASGKITGGQAAIERAKLEIQAAREQRALRVEEAKATVAAEEAARNSSDTALWRARVNVEAAADRAADPGRLGLQERLRKSLSGHTRDASEAESDLAEAKKELRKQQHALEGIEGWAQGKATGSASSQAYQDAAKEVDRLETAAKEAAKGLEETRQRLKGVDEEQRGSVERLKEREHEYDELKRTHEGIVQAGEKARLKLDELGKARLDLKAPKASGTELENSRASIEELAKSGWMQRTGTFSMWHSGPLAEKAQEIQRLQGEAHKANLEGDYKTRDVDNLRITQLKKELGASGALKSADYLEAMSGDIDGLYRLAAGEGLKVNPANGA
jgi:hypothetical protein